MVLDDASDPSELYRIRDGAYAADLILAAVCEFDLFTWLDRSGPVSAAELCEAMGWAARPADVLLTLCAAHGLVERFVEADDLVAVSELARRHLAAGSSFDLRAYYGSLSERPGVGEFAGVLRTDRPAGELEDHGARPGESMDAELAARVVAALDARGAFLAPALARTLADLPVRRLLDVGGGSGIYAMALLEDRPAARAAVLERPPVGARARELLRERGAAGRIEVITGDFLDAPLPTGFDTHLYAQVLHRWDALRVERLLTASFEALPPGGRVVDLDAHVDGRRNGPRAVAEYSALLVHSTPGKCWSTGELAQLAAQIGFTTVVIRTCTPDCSVVVLSKPG